MSRRGVPNIARLQNLFTTVAVSDMQRPLENVSPMGALTHIVFQPLQYWGEVRTLPIEIVRDRHSAPGGSLHFRARGLKNSIETLFWLLHSLAPSFLRLRTSRALGITPAF